MKTYIRNLIEKLFPPKLPRLHEWNSPEQKYAEQGACGKAQPKKYKDAIDRHWAEEAEVEDVMAKLAAGKGRFDF